MLNVPAIEQAIQRREMSAHEYRAQLLGLIEDAGIFLPDAESQAVLTGAFNLLCTRLGVKIKSHFHIPANDRSAS